MPEYERYNTRNVAQKEIYDSYMGILRISPNEINNTLVDDPTQILNTLHDEIKKKRTKVILSDSDGNVLPITFSPKAFTTTVKIRDSKTLIESSENVDVINMTTTTDTENGQFFITNNLTCRSTILITRAKSEEETLYRQSNLRILSGGIGANSDEKIKGNGWLLYPTESPNDPSYFNDKNKYGLFSEEDSSTPRYKQVENTLLTWTTKEHTKNIDNSERIVVNNKYVSEINQFNEEIPIYYTRDYILGHYDGHNIKTGSYNSMGDSWGINGSSTEGIADNVTKLSWLRIDKLIWDSLNEIMTGNVRHVKGRYSELGKDEEVSYDFCEKLGFNIGTEDKYEYRKFAPILGTEMPRGIITYHAMPFHRYWFHRTRQALRGFIERKKGSLSEEDIMDFPANESFDKWILSKGLIIGDAFDDTNKLIYDEIYKLLTYYTNDLISPCPTGTLGFVQSLAKNFVLCNGRNVTFANFPNLSLTNEVIFDTKINGVAGGIAKYDKTNGFKLNTLSGALSAFATSSGGGSVIKLPNLFALYESTPRFIRGLNWKVSNTDNTVTVFDKSSNSSTYINAGNSTNNVNMQLTDKHSLKKVFTTTNLPFLHTYDHLVKNEEHQHNMFSSTYGGSTGYYDSIIHRYHCFNTRREYQDRWYWTIGNMMNFNHTHSKLRALDDYYTYKFGPGIAINPDDNFLRYCMSSIWNNGKIYNFTPIPTTGLYLFNASIFNNKGGTYRGTTYDSDNERKNNFAGGKPSTNRKNYYYYGADGVKHTLEEAPISKTGYETSDGVKQHDLEKLRRKFFAMKMNEAEGFIPISVAGKASGYVILSYSRSERRGTKSSSRNTYDDIKKNVASYIMTPYEGGNTAPNDGYYWRCWSSIAYLNSKKLGVGNVSKYISNRKNYNENTDYYDVNCVTQLPKDEKYKTYKYGGVGIEVDDTAPTPPYINFLPLVRV